MNPNKSTRPKIPCVHCGSIKTKRSGTNMTLQGEFQLHHCNNCGKNWTGELLRRKR